MRNLAIILLLVSSSVALPWRGIGIIGGNDAKPHQFPYQAALWITLPGGISLCGGSLISPQYVLTAAHCLNNATAVEVVLGAHSLRSKEPEQVTRKAKLLIVHEHYNDPLHINDIALIKLSEAVELNENIQTVKLPTEQDASKTYEGQKAVVTGWGRTEASKSSEVLKYVKGPVITNEECKIFPFTYFVRETNICVSGEGPVGSCAGDSGGPLTVDDVQVGIVSYGFFQCASRKPTLYTRVTSYRDWIKKITLI